MVTSLKKKEDAVRQQLSSMKSKEDEAWTRYRTSGPEREALKKGLYRNTFANMLAYYLIMMWRLCYTNVKSGFGYLTEYYP